LATAAIIGVAALVAPSPAQAWRGGWGPGLAGGLIAGAVIGGIASSAYAYGPYGYYGGPGYGYHCGLPPRGLQLRLCARILWRIRASLPCLLPRVPARRSAHLLLRPPVLWRVWLLVIARSA